MRKQQYARCVVSWCLLGMAVCLLISGGKQVLHPQERGDIATGYQIERNTINAYGEGRWTGITTVQGYYRYDTPATYLIVKGRSEKPQPPKMVLFGSRKQAMDWAKKERYTIHWNISDYKMERRFRIQQKLPTVKGW